MKADQELYDQIPLMHEVVESFGLPIYEKRVMRRMMIGTIVKNLKGQRYGSVYRHGDMDTLRLVR